MSRKYIRTLNVCVLCVCMYVCITLSVLGQMNYREESVEVEIPGRGLLPQMRRDMMVAWS